LALKEAGCIFALDDFGAGQSSFRYLKGLPVNYLKIDGAFIRNIDQDKNDPTDEALVRGMHEIAKALKIGTVAEYVERKETSELLQNIGIDYAQGWYYHKAEPIANLLNSK
jgi:Amt family ammonium transporter